MLEKVKTSVSSGLLAAAVSVCTCSMAMAQQAPKTENDTLSNVEAYLHGTEQSPVKLPVETQEQYNKRMQWWKDAKYGMFIHWGLYSLLGGEYQGKVTPKIAEWIQNTLKIPLKDYQKLMKDFKAEKFDANAWCGLAKAAGMQYLVITSKHHDGFALFNTKASDYNVMNTPYGKDVIKQLKNACERQGIHFGVYYSHLIDWENPNAFIGNDPKLKEEMNTVDFDPAKMDRSLYLKEKAFPQLRELLSNYGKMDIIWFDMGKGLSNNEVREFVKIARELQPDIIISSRLGDFPKIEDLNRDMLFDFYTPSDNYFTGQTLKMPWEMAGSTNGSWGFRKDDTDWRSAGFIIQSLIASVSRGGNYLLNVGPDGQGEIPPEAAKQLRIAGKWLKKNQEAIYSSLASPFPWNYDWGYVTRKPGKIFLNVVAEKPTAPIVLPGMISKVDAASLLENHSPLKFSQNGEVVTVNLPKDKTDDLGYVIELDTQDQTPKIDTKLTQYQNGNVRLDRITGDYSPEEKMISWDFTVNQPGTYQIKLISNEKGSHHNPQWVGSDQKGSLQVGGKVMPVTLKKDSVRVNPTLFFYKEITSNLGTVTFDKPGTYTLHLKGFKIAPGKWVDGLGLDRIDLLPADK